VIRHIVAPGQTPGQVAERYGLAVEDLARLNGFPADQALPPGVMLWLPDCGAPPEEPRAPRAQPVLRVPEEVFAALTTLKDGNGAVALRIARTRPGEPLSFELP
jgi:hypothetical protein